MGVVDGGAVGWVVPEDVVTPLPGLSITDADVSEGYAGIGTGLGAVQVSIMSAHGGVAIDSVTIRGVYVVSTVVPSRARPLAPLTNENGTFRYQSNIQPLIGSGGAVVFIAELSVANDVLKTLTYQSPLNRPFTDNVTVVVSDLGNTGAGGPGIVTRSFAVVVTPVNDAPIIQAPSQIVTLEDMSVVAVQAHGVRVDDVDIGAGVFRVSLSVSFGVLTLSDTTNLQFINDNPGRGTLPRGTDEAVLVFRGQSVDVNEALHILTYRCVVGIGC